MTPNESSELLKTLEGKDTDVLLPLLSEYAERWRHSNNQMWSTGAVFIPLSLSGVALGVGDKYRTLFIAIFSVILIWIWYLITARLRSLIDNDWQVYAAIESTILKLNPPYLKRGLGEIVLSQTKKPASIRRIRLLIPMIVTGAWIVTGTLSLILP
jgi:hypothetical protein